MADKYRCHIAFSRSLWAHRWQNGECDGAEQKRAAKPVKITDTPTLKQAVQDIRIATEVRIADVIGDQAFQRQRSWIPLDVKRAAQCRLVTEIEDDVEGDNIPGRNKR